VDAAKNAAAKRRFRAVAGRKFELLEQGGKRFAGLSCFCLKRLQGFVALSHELVTPALRVGEDAFLPAIVSPEPGKQRMNRRLLDIAHELADELLLAALRFMRFHSPGFVYGVVQSLVKRQTIQKLIRQANQLFAEILQCGLRALFLTFAGL
jgi:hypothetical protein